MTHKTPKNLEQPYILLTPGPLTTSSTVKAAMLKDWCTWDSDYKQLVQDIRGRLVRLATSAVNEYTSVLIQGSGSYAVESVLGSAVAEQGTVLILSNGAYGDRMVQIAEKMRLSHRVLRCAETTVPDIEALDRILREDSAITHVACVHCETTTGILNPIDSIGQVVKQHKKIWIVDAMSSFGGIQMDVAQLDIDFLISSANKCIQGVPGFGFVIARRSALIACRGLSKSLCLDLFDQWSVMEAEGGKWRFTSPTHVVRAFYQALLELESEGGVAARGARYRFNQKLLFDGMLKMGFNSVVDDHSYLSPIITTFYFPAWLDCSFDEFYAALKQKGFVIYPGKISALNCFRMGNIGEVYESDVCRLLVAVDEFIKSRSCIL